MKTASYEQRLEDIVLWHGSAPLSIDLRMVGGAHPQGHATEPKQVLLEAAQKQGTMVCDQAPRHAVNFTHDIHEENDNWMSGVMDG